MKLRNIAIALCSAALTGCGSMAEWRTVPGEYYNQGTYYYGGYPPAPGYGQTPPPPPPTSKPHKPSKPTPPPQQHQPQKPQKPQKPQQQKPQQQKPQQQKPQQPTTNAQPNHPINTKPATPSTGNTSLRPGAANQTKPSTQPATQPAQPSRPATTGRH
nr:hypothetical protein [Bacteroides sp.]